MKRGFTLIELTVVIAIIASLSTVIYYFTSKMIKENHKKELVVYVDSLNEKLASCKFLEVNGKSIESKFETKDQVLAFLKTTYKDERLVNTKMNESISWDGEEQEFKQRI